MKKQCPNTASFVLTMPLRYSKGQEKYLDRQFSAANALYNQMVDSARRRLDALMRSADWQDIREAFHWTYSLTEDIGRQPDILQMQKNLGMMRSSLLLEYGLSEFSFHHEINEIRQANPDWKSRIGSHMAQKIASSVWHKTEDFLFGEGKELRFRPWTQCRSIEGKDNKTMLSIKEPGFIYMNRKMKLKMAAPQDDYQREALQHRVKYCRLIRIPWKKGWLYKVQLVLEGEPPCRASKDTMSKGRVGIDIGTQTVAAAGEGSAKLELLAPGAEPPNSELRRINRAMDRSRRANNPKMFAEDGSVIRRDRLPAECLQENGTRKWKDSRNYQRLAARKRYILAKLARVRQSQHNRLANEILKMGDTFYIEKMNFRALAKKAEQPGPDAAEKDRRKRRKRFGKSIASRAPAMFVDILERKVRAHGGTLHRINTWKARASQYNHAERAYKKTKLSQRTKTIDYQGTQVVVQRDLYSAFLLKNTNTALDGFDQKLCEETFGEFLQVHDMAIRAISDMPNLPSSMGVKKLKEAL